MGTTNRIPVSRGDLTSSPGLHKANIILSRDQLGISSGQCIGTDVILFDPAQTRPCQCCKIRPNHGFKSNIAGLGNEYCTDARRNIFSTGICLACMIKCICKPGSSLDLENHLWQINPRHPGINRTAQSNQACRFFQLIEG